MEITERIRLKDEDQTLQYDFHISGLGNEHSFDCDSKLMADIL